MECLGRRASLGSTGSRDRLFRRRDTIVLVRGLVRVGIDVRLPRGLGLDILGMEGKGGRRRGGRLLGGKSLRQ